MDHHRPSAFAYLESKAGAWLKMPAGLYRHQNPLRLADESVPEESLRPVMAQLAQGRGAGEDQPLQANSVEALHQALLTLHLIPQAIQSRLLANAMLDRVECRHAVMGTEITVFAEIPLADD